jgi:antitoxin VapB
MPLNIRDEEVNRLAGELARRTNRTKTDAVRQVLRAELERLDRSVPLWERLRPLHERMASYGSTGLPADKAFFDDLNGEP